MKEEKIKILGIVGPSGCGKDTAALHLATRFPAKYNYVVLNTTRPKRDSDDNGYNFIDGEAFLEKVLDGSMLNAQEFRGWYYGLSKDSLVGNKINVLPMSNVMVDQMLEEHREDYELKLIYIKTDDKPRLAHILKRDSDCVEICRRFTTDDEDYTKNEKLHDKVNCIIINNFDYNFERDVEEATKICFPEGH